MDNMNKDGTEELKEASFFEFHFCLFHINLPCLPHSNCFSRVCFQSLEELKARMQEAGITSESLSVTLGAPPDMISSMFQSTEISAEGPKTDGGVDRVDPGSELWAGDGSTDISEYSLAKNGDMAVEEDDWRRSSAGETAWAWDDSASSFGADFQQQQAAPSGMSKFQQQMSGEWNRQVLERSQGLGLDQPLLSNNYFDATSAASTTQTPVVTAAPASIDGDVDVLQFGDPVSESPLAAVLQEFDKDYMALRGKLVDLIVKIERQVPTQNQDVLVQSGEFSVPNAAQFGDQADLPADASVTVGSGGANVHRPIAEIDSRRKITTKELVPPITFPELERWRDGEDAITV